MNGLKWRTVWVLAKRELRSTIYGIGIYVTLSISLVVSSLVFLNYLKAVSRDQILITASPFAYPLFIGTGVFTVYLALASVTSIARERDIQTLELLFYGPVGYASYVFSKYLKGILSYLFIVVFMAFFFILASLTSNLELSWKFWVVLALSLFLSSCVITFGIFMSTLTESVRNSIFLFLVIIGGLIAIQISLEMLGSMRDENLAPVLVYVRNSVQILHTSVKWISPLYYFDKGMEAVSLGSLGKYVLSAVFSIIYSIVFLSFSILTLKWKGVRKTTGE
jgi:ABC-type transport system involved in multi-copper enzyme maturation permease subunit